MNEGPYVKRVKCLKLFGSVAHGKERPGDVDVYAEWEHYPPKEAERRFEERLKHAPKSYYWFRAECWVDLEPERFLRGRSRALSIHGWLDRKAVEASGYRVIFRARRKTQR